MNKLKLLLPIIFPKTISECPSKEAKELTTNSGAEVPKDTMVKPITRSEILFRLANAEAPSTSQFPPKIKLAKPIIISEMDVIIFYWYRFGLNAFAIYIGCLVLILLVYHNSVGSPIYSPNMKSTFYQVIEIMRINIKTTVLFI